MDVFSSCSCVRECWSYQELSWNILLLLNQPETVQLGYIILFLPSSLAGSILVPKLWCQTNRLTLVWIIFTLFWTAVLYFLPFHYGAIPDLHNYYTLSLFDSLLMLCAEISFSFSLESGSDDVIPSTLLCFTLQVLLMPLMSHCGCC